MNSRTLTLFAVLTLAACGADDTLNDSLPFGDEKKSASTPASTPSRPDPRTRYLGTWTGSQTSAAHNDNGTEYGEATASWTITMGSEDKQLVVTMGDACTFVFQVAGDSGDYAFIAFNHSRTCTETSNGKTLRTNFESGNLTFDNGALSFHFKGTMSASSTAQFITLGELHK